MDVTSSLSFPRGSADMSWWVNGQERRRMKLVLQSHERLGTTVLLVMFASIHPARGQEILSAAGAGDAARVAQILEADPRQANARDDQGTCPLHIAAKQCRADMMEMLLSRGADVNAKDKDGQTPLDRFAQSWCYDQERIVKLLRSRGGTAKN